MGELYVERALPHAAALVAALHALGKRVEIEIYSGADHAFFNDTRPDVYDADAAADAWRRTLEFFRAELG